MIDSANTDPRNSALLAVVPDQLDRDAGPYLDYHTLLTGFAQMAELFIAAAVGAAAAIDVALPFDPAIVLVINETTLAMFWHLPTMAAAAAFKQVTDGTLSKLTTNGITIGAKAAKTVRLGTSVQTTSDVLHVIAFGNRGLGSGAA
jgi:hypothetical protein